MSPKGGEEAGLSRQDSQGGEPIPFAAGRPLVLHAVEYLIVGGYALAFHGTSRFTGDLDVFVRPSSKRACKRRPLNTPLKIYPNRTNDRWRQHHSAVAREKTQGLAMAS